MKGRVVVFGASGQCGRLLLPMLVARGYAVTAVARAGAWQGSDGVRITVGDVLDAGFVKEAVAGHEVVISGLGIKRKNPANPWSRLASPADFSSLTARHIVDAMKAHGVGRVLAISAAGVAESAPRMNTLMKFLVATSNVGVSYRDLAVMESVYRDSGLDWCAPRPTRLTDGALTGKARVTEAFPTSAAISRADVAAFLADELESPRHSRQAPQITGP